MSPEQLMAEARGRFHAAVGPAGLEVVPVATTEAIDRVVQLIRLPAQERDPSRVSSASATERTRVRVQSALLDPHELIGVVQLDGAAIGALWVRLQRGPASNLVSGHLQEIVLEPSARGRGYGGHLMTHIESACAAAGARELTLNHMATNTRAAAFYERRGFARVGYDLSLRVGEGPKAPAVGLMETRRARSEQAGCVARCIIEGRLLCRFLRFDPDPAALEAEVRIACEHGQVLVTQRGTEVDAVCWFTREDSRLTGKPLLVVHALGGRSEESPPALLDALLRHERHPGLSEILITVWEPSSAWLAALLERGYRIGRAKLSKPLKSGREAPSHPL